MNHKIVSLPRFFKWLCLLAFIFQANAMALAAMESPLEPTDRSSPRATLESFLANSNASWEAALASTGTDHDEALRELTALRAQWCLDLSGVTPSEYEDTALESAIMLLDVLNRIELPALAEVPNAEIAEETGLTSWRIPGTPIVLEKITEGDQAGQWLFNHQVVNRIPELYRLTRELPLNPQAVVEDGYHLYSILGGSLVPNEWVLSLPGWALATYLGQAVWQWVSGTLLILLAAVLAGWLLRFSPPRLGLGEIGMTRFIIGPLLLMTLVRTVLYILDEQLNFTGNTLSLLKFVLLLIYYVVTAWLVARVCNLVGHEVKRRRCSQDAINNDVVDTLMFFISSLAAVLVLANGAATLGMPLAGVLTGLGVGGIAVALAAQSTLENLFGGVTLLLDRPVRVGEFCKFGNGEGTVERIGLRSTRIRTLERTIISVPNSEFSKTQIESVAVRDKIRLHEILYLRMYTSREQIQQVLTGLRNILGTDERIDGNSVRVRLVRLGPEALEVEVSAYARTRDWSEFLELKEASYLEFIRIAEEAGTAFVPPGQIQYNVDLEPIREFR